MTNNINEVLVDGQLVNASIDDAASLNEKDVEAPPPQAEEETPAVVEDEAPIIVVNEEEEAPKEEESTESPKRKWSFGRKRSKDSTSSKKSAKEEAESGDVKAEFADEEGSQKSSTAFVTTLGNIGSTLMNVCTLGLFASATTVQKDDPVPPPDKIVRELTASERELTMIEEDSDQGPLGSNDRSLLSNDSVPSDAVSDSSVSMVGKLTKQKKTQTIVYWSIGIFLFLAMVGLFTVGGIFLRRNGW